ncbi:MAG: tRNA pseudouridine(13) synthase TruD [Promethearchaeota archaeon]
MVDNETHSDTDLLKPDKTFSSYSAQEKYVGIEGYTTDTRRLGGYLKKDISDFIVREILPSGEILSTYDNESTDIPFIPKHDRATAFTLIKKKMDTIICAGIIKDYLGVPQNFIKWAGIKDHTAITAQLFTVRGNYINKLRKFSHPDITLTNIRPTRNETDLGRILGNNFSINIRKIHYPFEEIKDELEIWRKEIESRGFPNYFGMQRYGKHRPNSHIIGKLLFQEKYEDACKEFLFTVYPAEYEKNARFRHNVRNKLHKIGDDMEKKLQVYAEATRMCPRSLHYEQLVLNSLAQAPNDYRRAILSLPKALLNLILSSYQSFIFNLAVSDRINQDKNLTLPKSGDVISILKEPKGTPSLVYYTYQGGEGWNDLPIENAFKHNRATIIAPVPGSKTNLAKFPAFESIYRKILDEENFQLHDFKQINTQLFKFEGIFRPIFNFPTKLNISQAYITNKYPEKDPTGIHVEFSLPKGTYATMLLRELKKVA